MNGITKNPANVQSINNHIINIVIECLNGIRKFPDEAPAFRYLIGQTIRQYIIPDGNWHLTEAAVEKWDQLTSEDIRKFTYKETFHCNRLSKPYTELYFYKGSNNAPSHRKLSPNVAVAFNNIFIAEHTTPVSDIRKQLEDPQFNPTSANVKKVLDSIHITRMLKREDRKITQKNKRPLLFADIVKNVYNSVNITLKY